MAVKIIFYGIPEMGAGRKVAIGVEISQLNRLSKVWHTLLLHSP